MLIQRLKKKLLEAQEKGKTSIMISKLLKIIDKSESKQSEKIKKGMLKAQKMGKQIGRPAAKKSW